MIQPQSAPKPAAPSHRLRIAKFTARKRRAHARRIRYANVTRVVTILTVVVFPIMLYVMLTANITGLNYAISHAESERAQLQEEAQTLDDRIVHLESRDRLAVIAAKLGMSDTENFAVVPMPQPPEVKHSSLAFLDWFKKP